MVELSQAGSFAIGVIVGLLSTAIQGVGLTLQRKSHLLEEEKDEYETRRPPYKRRRWQIGFGMFLLSNIVGSTIQMTTLPLPVLSTLQASGLVFNSICASLILKEPFTWFSLAGTILVAGGAALIGTYGSMSEPSHTLNQLLYLLGRPHFLLWLFSTLLVVVAVQVGAWAYKRFSPRQTPRSRLFRGMSFGFISGVLSAHTLLLAKSAVELLVRTIADRHNQFDRWQSWMILLGLVALALLQLWYLHRGLKLCSTSVLYPFVFCIYNIIAIIDGLIYFDQTSRLRPLHAGLVAVGTVILLSGVLALSWRLEQHGPGAASQSKIGQPGNIAPPITALTPGMGIVNPDAINEDNSESAQQPFLTERYEQSFDEEHGFSAPHPLHRPPTPPNRRSSPSDERTPLLRAPTDSATLVRSRKSPKGTNFSPRRPKRGFTLTQEATDIWDELHDRHHDVDNRRRSLNLDAQHSPRSSRSDPWRRPRSGTLPPIRTDLPSPSRSPIQWRRRSWWAGLTGTPSKLQFERRGSEHATVSDGEEDRDEDGEEADHLIARNGARDQAWAKEEPGAWFQLRWWKKRWRGGETENREEDQGP